MTVREKRDELDGRLVHVFCLSNSYNIYKAYDMIFP